SPEEASSYNNIVMCGETIANQAINTFLKLLLKMLSPRMFANKFPEIWSHDHRGGYAEPGVLDGNAMIISIRHVEGFSHVGPIAVGFVGVALRAGGLKDLKMKDQTWSRAIPGPRDIRIEATWK